MSFEWCSNNGHLCVHECGDGCKKESQEMRPASALLNMLADAIAAHQCGDEWDIIGFSEAEHARLPSLLREIATTSDMAAGRPRKENEMDERNASGPPPRWMAEVVLKAQLAAKHDRTEVLVEISDGLPRTAAQIAAALNQPEDKLAPTLFALRDDLLIAADSSSPSKYTITDAGFACLGMT